MNEKPILFSEPMVRAILNGHKTVTRRVVNFDTLRVVPRRDVSSFHFLTLDGDTPLKLQQGKRYKTQFNCNGSVSGFNPKRRNWLGLKPDEFDFVCPFCTGTTYLRGNWMIRPESFSRLWVRETWAPKTAVEDVDHMGAYYYADSTPRLTHPYKNIKWHPSIHMPRCASRITLTVKEVRIERLHNMIEADARKEGVDSLEAFIALWNRINASRGFGWNENPWVWVVSFSQI